MFSIIFIYSRVSVTQSNHIITWSSWVQYFIQHNNHKMRRETFKFWDVVCLILDVWWYLWKWTVLWKDLDCKNGEGLLTLMQIFTTLLISLIMNTFMMSYSTDQKYAYGSYFVTLVKLNMVGSYSYHSGTRNILRPRQNGCHFPDDIFKCIFFERKWMNFLLKVYWSLFTRVQLTIFGRWFG